MMKIMAGKSPLGSFSVCATLWPKLDSFCCGGLPMVFSCKCSLYYSNRKLDVTQSYKRGQISDRELQDAVWKNVFQGKLTYLHWSKGEAMAPTIGEQGGTLLIRKIPSADPGRVFVGDVIVMKDPDDSDNYLVRRLAATEGYEMVSKDEKDEPFVLEKDQCWVLADNEKLKPKVLNVSNTTKTSSNCYS
ncbi:hypothetical protein Golob_019930, partial [Gossypium lobatum]|nr:hypothetical protein [Gossypium lobatum]